MPHTVRKTLHAFANLAQPTIQKWKCSCYLPITAKETDLEVCLPGCNAPACGAGKDVKLALKNPYELVSKSCALNH